MSPHVRIVRVTPDTLGAAPGWCPSFFVGPASVAFRAGQRGPSIRELGGEVLEGWRASETPGTVAYDPRIATTPVYRPSNIGFLRLLPSAEHWGAPPWADRWSVEPGDVVLGKFAPLRAALVSPAARRHPADGNSLIVRGMEAGAAAWVALCLGQPEYEQLLLSESPVLRRTSIGGLSTLRVPPVPPRMEGLSARLLELLDEYVFSEETVRRLKHEAAEVVGGLPGVCDLRAGARFRGASLSCDNWLPSAVALRAEQSVLAAEQGWAPLHTLALPEDRTRLFQPPQEARPLRLGDVSEDLFVKAPTENTGHAELVPSRTLARPLVPGEVLVSTLGMSMRVCYADDGISRTIFPTDGWVRFRFRETPAAWALMLSAEGIRSQAARLAIGSVQQFVPPDALRSLLLPVPSREVRERWQRSLESHHARRRLLDRKWGALEGELTSVFRAVHRPFEGPASRAQEVLQ